MVEKRLRTRIKVCGLREPEHARLAGELGVDAIGLVFYARSPRAVSPEQAAAVVAACPPFLTTVGLFVDPDPGAVEGILDRVPLDLLQFHGDECPSDCRRYGRPYIKAIPAGDGTDVRRYAQAYPDAQGFLIDSHAKGETGGTGMAFDWRLWPSDLDRPLILAGGLSPDNVAEAIRRLAPYGVDVSSGVESERGVKDPQRMIAFCREVRRADAER